MSDVSQHKWSAAVAYEHNNITHMFIKRVSAYTWEEAVGIAVLLTLDSPGVKIVAAGATAEAYLAKEES